MSYLKTSSTGPVELTTAGRISGASDVVSRRRALAVVKNLLQLTKPSIMLLVLITGAGALVLEGSMMSKPFQFLVFMIGLYLTGGAANALNQYFEREIDGKMKRTRHRRPLPTGKISAREALFFTLAIGAGGVLILGLFLNWLTAALSLATILFYSLFYTLWLKPHTAQNIVIGGIAGAMAPVGAWTAATGSLAVYPWILFLIIFLWTPPHFWALALCFKDDYRAAGLPMLPLKAGDRETVRQILIYSLLLAAASSLPLFYGAGPLYLGTAAVVNFIFIYRGLQAWRTLRHKEYWTVFKFSLIHLFALFVALIADKYI